MGCRTEAAPLRHRQLRRAFGPAKALGGFNSWGGIDIAAGNGHAAALVASDAGPSGMTWQAYVRE
ncbi:MAG: hypothetical protein V9G19_03990 [Tetrasphaera sp.]